MTFEGPKGVNARAYCYYNTYVQILYVLQYSMNRPLMRSSNGKYYYESTDGKKYLECPDGYRQYIEPDGTRVVL